MVVSVKWGDVHRVESKTFVCGYCGADVASNEAMLGQCTANGRFLKNVYIYICHKCSSPNYFDLVDTQFPAPAYGKPIPHLPVDVETIYNEAHRNTIISAPNGISFAGGGNS